MIIQSLIISIVLANPQSLLESAENSITTQNWNEAAKALDEYIRTENNPTAEAMYDRGIAHYNLGEYEVATQAFDEAMVTSNDLMLQSYSAFNLGNSIYKQTLGALEGTGTGTPDDEAIDAIENAKAQIKQVLANYRTAIANDATDMDARANGELAWQMLQQLDNMQEQMEKQQQQDEQKQEQNEESADQQKQDDEQSDEGESSDKKEQQQKQDGEQSDENEPSDKEEQQQKQDGEQSDENEPSDKEEQQQKQDGEQSDENEPSDKEEQQQKQDGEQSDENEPSNKEEQQPQDGELESTNEEMNEMKAPSTSVKDEGERLSEDEANRLLQLIRDKEQQRRKAIAARRAANRVPVGKDW